MRRGILAHERLLEVLAYCPLTGRFEWRLRMNRRPYSVEAGCLTKRVRRVISIDGHQYKASRLAWFYVHGKWPDGVIDHLDHDTLNDAIENLRDVSVRVNTENQIRPQSRSTTGLLGVFPHRQKWGAKIAVNGVGRFIGVFAAPEEAHAAYVEAKRRLHEGCTL
jgi:hypothetical protein